MNVFTFTSKHIAARIMAVMTLFALFTSLIPSQAFAAPKPDAGQTKTYTASVNPGSILVGETKQFTFTINNTSGTGGAEMKSFRIVKPAGFNISNIVLTQPASGWGIGVNGSNVEASDSANPDPINPGSSAQVTMIVTQTSAAPGPSSWTICAFKNNSFNPGSGAQFDPEGCIPTTITVTAPVVPCDAPYTGNQPNCVPPPCEQGWTGTYPNCVPPVVACEAPYTGNQPNCVPPPCEQGQTGTYPNCVTPPPPSCSDGIQNQGETGIDEGGPCTPPPTPCDAPYTGNVPNCVPPPCDPGYSGTYPDCIPDPVACDAPYTGNVPNCVPPPCEQGWTGTYPNCVPPVTPCPDGYTGIYPNCVPPNPDPIECTLVIVSNTNTDVVERDTKAVVTFEHGAWTADNNPVMTGASWIWADALVQDPDAQEIYNFQNRFGFEGVVTSATLYVASDNHHQVDVNAQSFAQFTGTSYNAVQAYDVTDDIEQGNNELTIEVTNLADVNNPELNPAGVLYRLVIEGEVTDDADCAVPYEEPVDMCLNVDGFQSIVPEDLVRDGNGNCNEPVVPVCEIGNNLLSNPSFELPVIGSDWALSSITDWVITNDADQPVQGEIWRGYVAPSDGLQNVELGAEERTTITQTVNTVVGATYKFSFDFAARGTDEADNNVNVLVDGGIVLNVSSGVPAWATHSYSFVATDTTTDIALQDIGTQNSTGSLVDNTVLCFESDPEVVPPPRTFKIFGYVWHDDNENEDWDGRYPEEQNQEEQVVEEEGEEPLAGRVITIENDEYSTTTTTDSDGYYEFEVPAGTWTITETLPEGWEHTYNESYEVTVPQIPVPDVTFMDVVREFFIPTAHAQLIAIPVQREYGEYNFGNDETPGRSGGGGGSLLPPSSRTPAVRGDRTDGTPAPQPQVLGEQVSLVPVGAPDAGAGGTSPLSINLPTLVAAFVTRQRLDV